MITVKCPKCREILTVEDNKKYSDCLYCGEEFAVHQCKIDKEEERKINNNKEQAKNMLDKLFKS